MKGDSPATWKGIKYKAKILKGNIQWIVGNGKDTFFWTSKWSRLGLLTQWATVPITNDQLNAKVSQFVMMVAGT